jgi:hypothetical protein
MEALFSSAAKQETGRIFLLLHPGDASLSLSLSQIFIMFLILGDSYSKHGRFVERKPVPSPLEEVTCSDVQ